VTRPVNCCTTSDQDFFTPAQVFFKESEKVPALIFLVPYIDLRRSASLALNASSCWLGEKICQSLVLASLTVLVAEDQSPDKEVHMVENMVLMLLCSVLQTYIGHLAHSYSRAIFVKAAGTNPINIVLSEADLLIAVN
jgi:hypothetical protein